MIKEELPEAADAPEVWVSELERVGLVRRMFLARRWYGADWWFVAISTVMVLGFIFVALFPGLLAPFSPNDLVGSRLLAPGAQPAVPVLIVPAESPINELVDLAAPAGAPRPAVGVVQGLPTGAALNGRAN